MELSTHLEENIRTAESLLPIGRSFDLISRQMLLGRTRAYFLGINGFCQTDLLQQIFSDLQNPLYMTDDAVRDIQAYLRARIGYVQVRLVSSWEEILRQVLSGPSVLLIDGFERAILLDVRSYPARGISEPDSEQVTRGPRDGFVETLLFNTNLIRRRIRSPKLTFSLHTLGTDSQTDVALAYMEGLADEILLQKLRDALASLKVSSLTMGAKSLEELLVQKRWFNPLPSLHKTERPDVACSCLMEGHILILVDNTPVVLLLPSTVFQFTQSPDDYYFSPVVGSYFRLVRFGCILVSLLLLPIFLLLTAYYPAFTEKYGLLTSGPMPKGQLLFYVLAVEFLLDLFKYSAAHSSSRFSGSLSIIGGLIIGDIAIQLRWASLEVLFYAAVTLLTTLTLSSVEFGDGLRIYRIFLILTTALLGLPGFLGGLCLILLSVCTTPTFGGMSYLWPLFPFNKKALGRLLLRCPTPEAQPSSVWNREPKEPDP